jgi:hypothetical protein
MRLAGEPPAEDPMPDILDFFRDRKNIDEVTAQQNDPRTVPGELLFLQSVPVLPATDRDLTMRWRTTPVIMDMISLDARATVYRRLQAKFQQTEIPKFKFGVQFTESDVREMLGAGQMELNLTGRVPEFVTNLFGLMFRQLAIGRRWRLETVLLGAVLNGFPYDRMGIRLNGTFNRPSDTIATVSPAWTDATNGKPLTNIAYYIDYMRIRYGVNINRFRSSRAAFDVMVATDEFKEQSRFHINSLFNTGELPVLNREENINVFKRMIPAINVVEFYDAHYRWEDDTSTRYLQRLLPLNAVILDSTDNDNNPNVWYLGNAPVTESAFLARVGAQTIGEDGGNPFAGMVRGPYNYTTVPHDLNPPQIQAWAVQHAWPILRDPNPWVVLYIGTITETITVTDTF